jgi:hypothetical protein
VLGSYFGSMSARARYRALGEPRLSGEKELILCNLMIRRARFSALGGFREDLYPNEENEFLNRLQAAGGRLCYSPWAVVERPRRGTLAAFAAQAFNYGRGRMRQMRANFFKGDLVHLLPPAALVIAAALPWLAPQHPLLWSLPLAYMAADSVACAAIAIQGGGAGAALLGLVLFPLRHGAYGLGMLAGVIPAYSGASPAATGTSQDNINSSFKIKIEKVRT